MTGEVITGGADCWGNSDLVQYMCEQCGIPAHIRNANFEPGAGAGHENDIVKIGSDYYIVDCGYTGNAPRYYVFAKSNDDFEYKILDDGTAELQSDMKFDSDVITIPAEINGYKVSSIRRGMLQEREYSQINVAAGSEYFSSKNGVLYSADGKTLIACPRKKEGSYKIADGTETVGEYAFLYCDLINEITMPDSLKSIGHAGFEWCSKLSVINWSNHLETIGENAFTACGSLKTIILPESVRRIESDAFNASMNPDYAYIPSGVTYIASDAFSTITFLVIDAENPEIEEDSYSHSKIFCHPGSEVDKKCGGTHYDIGMLDENHKLILQKAFFSIDLSERTYSGEEQEPTVRIAEDYKWLKTDGWIWSEDQDEYIYNTQQKNYTVSYENNVNVGTAKIRISGKNWCSGTIEFTFTIKPKQVFSSSYYSYRMRFKDTESRSAAYDYTGENITPTIEIVYAGTVHTEFIEGRDYLLTYADNKEIGYDTGTITLEGTGNYSGSDTVKFTIQGQLPEPDPIPDQIYTGGNLTPEVSLPGLKRNTDYYVSYSNNWRPGIATVKISGSKCYKGFITLNFNIYKQLPAIYHINDQVFTGTAITPVIYIPGAVNGVDYTVTYSNNIAVGTATVTAKAIESRYFKGTL